MNKQQFLDIDLQKIESIDDLYEAVKNQLISTIDSPTNNDTDLRLLESRFYTDRFSAFLSIHGIDNDLKKEFSIIENNWDNNRSSNEVVSSLKIHLKVLNSIYSSVRNSNADIDSNLTLYGFYEPNNSRIGLASKLVLQAIELIKSDQNISEKAKKAIIKSLLQAIEDLNNPKSTRTQFLGKSLIILSILSNILTVSGYFENRDNLVYQAKEKIEQAVTEVFNNSGNSNFETNQMVFNDTTSLIETNRQNLSLNIGFKEEE